VSAHDVPVQSPERQSESAAHAAPPTALPRLAERPSHSGRTHTLPPAAVPKHTVDVSQSAEVQQGFVQKLV
jgi:hypothetical protein